MILIEAAVTLPVVMYIMLFCLELVKIHLLQISIDKICAECVYHMCSERTALSFGTIFRKYTPSYIPVGYMRYWVRIYTSLDKMMSESPYGGERIAFPNNHGSETDDLTAPEFGNGIGSGTLTVHRKYGTGDWMYASISSSDTPALMRNGIPKGYAFVLTVVARHKFSSAFVEKLFSGGTNTNKAGYYILWSRGVGIVN